MCAVRRAEGRVLWTVAAGLRYISGRQLKAIRTPLHPVLQFGAERKPVLNSAFGWGRTSNWAPFEIFIAANVRILNNIHAIYGFFELHGNGRLVAASLL